MKMMTFRPVEYEGLDYRKMCETYRAMGFQTGQSYLVLGEVENMPGHLAVVNDHGAILPGMHDENFAELEDASTTVYTSDDDFEDE